MIPRRDITAQLVLDRSARLARELLEAKKQLSAAINDNRELRRRLEIRQMATRRSA